MDNFICSSCKKSKPRSEFYFICSSSHRCKKCYKKVDNSAILRYSKNYWQSKKRNDQSKWHKQYVTMCVFSLIYQLSDLPYSKIAEELGMSRQNLHQKLNNYTTHNNSRIKKIYGLKNNCYRCGAGNSELHHKDGNCRNNERSNLIILCHSCHKKEHTRIKNG